MVVLTSYTTGICYNINCLVWPPTLARGMSLSWLSVESINVFTILLTSLENMYPCLGEGWI